MNLFKKHTDDLQAVFVPFLRAISNVQHMFQHFQRMLKAFFSAIHKRY